MASSGTHVAILTNDVLAERMAGPAIRAWNMAAVLAGEHDVRLVSTVGPCTLSAPTFRAEQVDDDGLRDVEAWADVLVFQGAVMYQHPFLYDSAKVVVADIYNPMHLETLEQAKDRGENRRRLDVYNETLVLSEQLARGDFFLSASPKQRTFWLGHLAAIGRVNAATYDDDPSLNRLIAVVPFGVVDRPPRRSRAVLKGVVPGIDASDKVILWGGGIYNWFDPLTLLHAMDQLRRRVPNARLYFLGLRHPNPQVPAMRMAADAMALSERLGLTGTHVFFNEDWVPYDERENYLLESDVGVSTHFDHVETAMSFRTRILDYLWAGLPVVTTSGDFFGDLVERDGLGRTVPPEDADGLAVALEELLDDELARECGRRSTQAAQEFVWPRVMQPMVDFCRNPHRAPDLLDAQLAGFIAQNLRPPRPPHGVVDNLHILLDHWSAGGLRLVATKATSRIMRRATEPGYESPPDG